MPQKKITFDIAMTDGTKTEASFTLPTAIEKQKWVGASTDNSPLLIVDDIAFSFIPGSGSTTGLAVSVTEGTATIDGFHWCLYGTNSRSNFLIDGVKLTTTPLALPDTGITEAQEWRKMWFWKQGVVNTTLYRADVYKRGTKIMLFAWKE